ncbi:acyl-CoA carboxylase subunit beta [Streptomyces sp. CA-210063]|uniref:acyl-CoA carboxylase subunit beta n=1 Tax=Streptomyces sp. CA-210063 TaxID=2801029 RepID=UPI00214ABD1A|nr:acyl-CoA carboxylase subunit beta [Streptomyces sp. CA-210063]UUU31898.1 acyl-CoA carboxylase subunit beta [Streptomyces sp. CA-210063]
MTVAATDVHTTARKSTERLIGESAALLHTVAGTPDTEDEGRVTARQRVEQLLDEGSFVELDEFLGRHASSPTDTGDGRLPGDGAVCGHGTVDGRPVAVFAFGFPGLGSALSEAHARKAGTAIDFALKTGCPVIAIHDTGGTRIQDSTGALGAYGQVLRRHARASGVVPQISLITGSCTGSGVHSPALTDFTVMVDRTSHLLTTAPDIVTTVTGEEVDPEELGGARTHNTVSGSAHHLADSDEDAVEYVKALLSYLPSNNLEDPPAYPDEDSDVDTSTEDRELDTIVPETAHQPYDMHRLVECLLDEGELLQTQALFAPNIITGFGRVEGRPVGVVANQPLHLAGCLDIDASEKAARFIRTCDAFNVPVLTFVDVPGFLPVTEQELRGIGRRAAKLAYAYAEATVPLITVVTRKAYGGAYDIMGSKQLGADLAIAWPTAQIAVSGARDAVGLLDPVAGESAEAEDPAVVEARRAQLMSVYQSALLTPRHAAERGHVDTVIAPSRTREYLVRGLRALSTKREAQPERKHGNIPL